MALKDLTTSGAKLHEQQIEDLVSPYVRFDPDAGRVIFLPAARPLSSRQRTLLYLAALQGWPFVTDKQVSTSATPAEISKALHIPGGTLRPLLKELKEGHLVTATGRAYSVSAAALDAVKAEMSRVPSASSLPAKPSRKEKGARAVGRARGAGPDKATLFNGWIQEGFFKQPRTLRDVAERFRREGQIIPLTSVPQYLLSGIRDRRLTRERKVVGGRQVWVYRAARTVKETK